MKAAQLLAAARPAASAQAGGKHVTLNGLVKSQHGSLTALDESVDKLPNSANAQD
jgi:hypothetical protein